MDVRENGFIQVHESIDVSNCEDLQVTKIVPLSFAVTDKTDDTIKEVTYNISNVAVENHDFTQEETSDSSLIKIVLPKKTDSLEISYEIQLGDFGMVDQQMFYYTLYSGFQGSILAMEAEMNFPTPLDTQPQLINADGKLVSDYTITMEESRILIKSTKSLPFGTVLSVKSSLPLTYFSFNDRMDIQMIVTFFSILMVCGSFVIYMSKEKSGNRKKLFMSHPPKKIPMILYGYIMDGYISDKDFFPLLVDWANHGYIWIEETNQDVKIILRQELPAQAAMYEKLFFDAIFGKKTVVNLYDLEHKDFTLIFDELKENVYETFCGRTNQCVYFSNHIYHQILCCILAGVPMCLAMYAAMYSENYDLFQSAIWAGVTWLIISLSCIPWCLLVKRYPMMSNKSSKGMFTMIAILQSIILFVSGYIMLMHQMNFIYIIMNILMTIFFMLDLFILDRRTKIGSRFFKQVGAFDNFIRQSRVAQIDELVYREPHYYYIMLPYAFALDVVQIFSGKFTALMIQKPFWFLMPKDSGQSMYWVEPLVYALDDISTAILQRPSQSKMY